MLQLLEPLLVSRTVVSTSAPPVVLLLARTPLRSDAWHIEPPPLPLVACVLPPPEPEPEPPAWAWGDPPVAWPFVPAAALALAEAPPLALALPEVEPSLLQAVSDRPAATATTAMAADLWIRKGFSRS
ncbi:hypothetical protein GCM10009864_78590 [Streptomyces lunalinharesii]|uniref:Secreted protein n=1 Tax=Streptomyces lunalinharesii TaxID=333384 RepID=A0ABN3T2T2_9ACTN